MAASQKSKSSKLPLPNNPLLSRWSSPFGAPPFSRIQPQHYQPAFKHALAEHRSEIREIAASAAHPTFANTIRALEKGGTLLNKVAEVFFNLTAAHTNEALQSIERDLAPKLSDHHSAILLNGRLFKRIDDLFQRRAKIKLTDEEARVLERTHTAFVRAGAKLAP